jgi:hypothetical protein
VSYKHDEKAGTHPRSGRGTGMGIFVLVGGSGETVSIRV